jgi:hypothetical protein
MTSTAFVYEKLVVVLPFLLLPFLLRFVHHAFLLAMLPVESAPAFDQDSYFDTIVVMEQLVDPSSVMYHP